jgi:YidC/Oxa1 family membrane protein insertase
MRPVGRAPEHLGSDALCHALFRFSEGFLVLVLPYHLIMSLSAVVSGGLAIVLFTMAVRGALLPLSIRAARANKSSSFNSSKLTELRAKHGGDPEAFAAALRTSGVNPFAGLLPGLLQLPFFMILYRLFNASTVDGHPNGLMSHSVLGVHLGTHFYTDPAAVVFWLVFAALAAIAWYASRRLKGWLRVMPFFTVLVAAYVPLAAGLYLITSTAWTAVERTILSM